MLKLKNQQPVSAGDTRDIYEHPFADDLLIKIMNRDRVKKRWAKKASRKSKRRYGFYYLFYREIQEYIAIKAKQVEHPFWLQRIHGFIDTDLGLGLVVEKLKDREGRLAKNLQTIIKEQGLSGEMRRQLKRFIDAINHCNDMVISNLQLKNLVYVQDPAGGDRLVLVDGLGEKSIVPIHSIFGISNRWNTRKHIHRLNSEIEQAILSHRKASKKLSGPAAASD